LEISFSFLANVIGYRQGGIQGLPGGVSEMVRLQVVLDPTEASVLAQWAESEMRDPRDQIRFVLRQELERRGLLPTDAEQVGEQEMGEARDVPA
jgi:hypothetical protein